MAFYMKLADMLSLLSYSNIKLARSTEELAAAKLSAEQASKAKDHFLAVLSHELRTPLNPVLATASMLQKDPRFDADTREQLEVIRRNVELEARLIDDLLDVTRIERGKVELDRRPVELCTIIRRAVEVCLPDIEARKLEFGIDARDRRRTGSMPTPPACSRSSGTCSRTPSSSRPVGGCVGIRCRRDGDGHRGRRGQRQRRGDRAGGAAAAVQRLRAGRPADHPAVRRPGAGADHQQGAWWRCTAAPSRPTAQGKGKGATFTVRLPLLPAEAAMAGAPPASGSAGSERCDPAAADPAGGGPRRHGPDHAPAAVGRRAMQVADRRRCGHRAETGRASRPLTCCSATWACPMAAAWT